MARWEVQRNQHVVGTTSAWVFRRCPVHGCHPLQNALPLEIPMNLLTASDAPPTDFVAFLAQRGGLSPEAAEHRLERWFGEYHASACKKTSNAGSSDSART